MLMGNVFEDSLYKKQNEQFKKINEQTRAFAANYCGNTIIRDSIFGIISNYARRQGLSLEVLRYPFMDDELWAFTFVKTGTVFLCVNSGLAICKQIFAAAHELYHIHCYAEDINASTIAKGSLLDAKIFDEAAVTQEDLEANAFAGLLLMPDARLIEQIQLFGISGEKLNVDDVLVLMDLFALPYKAVVLRLAESRIISEKKAQELLKEDTDTISVQIELTGISDRWQQNSKRILHYGSLLKNLTYNSENELLTDSREESDKAFLEKIRQKFQNES